MLSVIEKYAMDEGDLQINLSEKSFMVKSGNLEISSALIDGKYPAWQKVLPGELNQSITLSKIDLENALKSAVIMAAKNGRIEFSIEKDRLTVTTPETEMGSCKEEIEAKYNGEPAEISINTLFLTDILKILKEDSITIEFQMNDDKKVSKALLIKESSVSDSIYTHIIMPMSI